MSQNTNNSKRVLNLRLKRCPECKHFFGECDLDCNCLCDKFALKLINKQSGDSV